MFKQIDPLKNKYGFTNLISSRTENETRSTTSETGLMSTVKNTVKNKYKSVKQTIVSAFNDLPSLLVLMVDSNVSSDLKSTYKKGIDSFCGISISDEEYDYLVGQICSKKVAFDRNSICTCILNFRAEKENARLKMLEVQRLAEVDRIRVQETKLVYDMCTQKCQTLSKPLNEIFTEEQISTIYNYIDRSGNIDAFMKLCNEVKDIVNSEFEKLNPDPSMFPNESDDDRYLNIVRKYILTINNGLLLKISSVPSVAKYSEWGLHKYGHKLIQDQAEELCRIIDVPCDCVKDIPFGSIAVMLVCGALSIELNWTAFKDVNISSQKYLATSLNTFGVLMIVAFAREGLPIFIDNFGIVRTIQKTQQVAYTMFHDYVKPVVDFGISFCNEVFEQRNIPFSITKNQTWNQRLQNNIVSRIPCSSISMGAALWMLHVFRVGDAFLSSLIRSTNIFDGTLKENLLKLSPLPQNNEEQKLIELFWGNPYVSTEWKKESDSWYGVIFNYDAKIEQIYSRYLPRVTRDTENNVIIGSYIYRAIHLFNAQIGKSNVYQKDTYLAYVIAARILDNRKKGYITDAHEREMAIREFARRIARLV